MKSPHLLLVGGGHASVAVIAAAERLRAAGARLTLMSEHRALFYSGMVPEMTGGVYEPADAQIDLRHLAEKNGVAWLHDRAVAVQPDGRGIKTASGTTVSADLLVFNIGSVTANREQAEGAVPSKPLHHIQRMVELAEAVESGTRAKLVIVGGGAAGVEIALNMSARCRDRLAITIVEPETRLLTEFPASLGQRAERVLRGRGVQVRLGCRAIRASEQKAYLEDGETLPADEVLWATGPAAPAIFAESSLPVDSDGFLRVEPTLQVTSLPHVFGAGDCVSIAGMPALQKIGVHAVKQGPLLSANILRAVGALRKDTPLGQLRMKRYRPYPIAPLILSTGKEEGWIATEKLWFRGSLFLRIKHLVDLNWMARYRSSVRFGTIRKRLHVRSATSG